MLTLLSYSQGTHPLEMSMKSVFWPFVGEERGMLAQKGNYKRREAPGTNGMDFCSRCRLLSLFWGHLANTGYLQWWGDNG